MPVITFNNKEYYARDGELLLDCLMRHGVTLDVNGTCDDGTCHRCKLNVVSAEPGAAVVSSLTEDLQRKGDVLSCVTMVWRSMAVVDSEPAPPPRALP